MPAKNNYFLFKSASNSRIVVRATDLAGLGDVPMEIELLPVGKWSGYRDRTTGEPIEIDVTMDDLLAAVEYRKQQMKRYPDRDLVIDYEHQTLMDVQAPAAGWMGEFFIRNNSLWAKIKYWTPTANQYLKNKEYRYFSPVFAFNDIDKETGETIRLMIKNGALTNEPFIDKLKPVVAKDNSEVPIYYLNNNSITKPQGDKPMLEEILKYLAAMLGLDATATWETIKQKLESFKQSASDVSAKYTAAMKELGIKEDASLDVVKQYAAKVKSIFTELGIESTAELPKIKEAIAAKAASPAAAPDMKNFVAKSDYDALKTRFDERDATEALDAAVMKGKILPATLEHYKKMALKDLPGFKELMAKTPDYSAVPLQEIEAKGQQPVNGEPTVEAIKEYAAKNKLSFRDAAIAMSKKK